MSIFAPKGIIDGEVVDPDTMSDDFIEASRIAENQTQYQWKKDLLVSGTDIKLDKLVRGGPVKIHTVNQQAKLRLDFHRIGTTDGRDPDLYDAASATSVGDPELFHIPYNRGYHLITGTNNMSLQWESEYPELIFAFFSFQYSRNEKALFDLNDDFSDSDARIRMQIKLMLDGSAIYGSGISSMGTLDGYRGTGYAGRNLRTTTHGLTLLGPGSHIIEAHAGQTSCSPQNLDTSLEPELQHFNNPPDEGVCIAHRTLNVIRFPKGSFMGA